MKSESFMRLEIASLPDNVGVARVAIASFASQLDFTLSEVDEIKVAVSEAVTNAVIHGYRDCPGLVRITAVARGDELEITVEDEGSGIPDVEAARQPSFSTDPDRMGLGFVFMESFMDELEVASRPGEGTRVRMVKRPQTMPGSSSVASAGQAG